MPRSTLLLMELNPHIAGIAELFFQGRGYEVYAASSAPEALAYAAHADVQAVVLHHVPGLIDAFELAGRLVAMSSSNPIVIVTVGSDDPAEVAANLPPWVDAVVPRPYHPRAICEAMRAISRRRSSEIAAVAAPPGADLSTSAVESTLPQ